jgi:hypothetical protein
MLAPDQGSTARGERRIICYIGNLHLPSGLGENHESRLALDIWSFSISIRSVFHEGTGSEYEDVWYAGKTWY